MPTSLTTPHVSPISFSQALKLCTSLPRVKATHTLPLFQANGAILAQDIRATRPLPAFTNSAMDGYAILLEDYGKECLCNGTILAGDDASNLSLKPGRTYKVMTGSMLPQNTQAVVQIEWVQHRGDSVLLKAQDRIYPLVQGQNIRFEGEEIKQGDELLTKGVRLNHLDLSVIASQGISHIECFKTLNIGIFSSGDEVIEPGKQAQDFQTYNTNATSLYALLSQYYNCNYGGILRDNEEFLTEAIKGFGVFDVVITSGGASVGDADLLKTSLVQNGAEILFDGVNVKPGRHIALAKLGQTYIILLPGNPLALLLHLHTLILPLLESLQGSTKPYPKPSLLKLSESLKLKANTTSIILGKIEGQYFIPHNHGKIGSSSLINMWHNHAIALFDGDGEFKDQSEIQAITYTADFSSNALETNSIEPKQ